MKTMKRVFCLLVLNTLLVSASAYGFRMGIQGGMNLSSASVDPAPSPALENRNAIVAGGFFDFEWESPLYVVLEANYTGRGFKQSSTTTKIDYLSFGSLLKIQPSLGGIYPFAIFGPSFDLKLSASTETGGTSTSLTSVSGIDFPLHIGAGLEIDMPFWPFNFFASARYSFGWMDVDTGAATSVKNKGLQILGGFIIREL